MSDPHPDFSKILAGFEKYPKPKCDLEYGTAGFRTKADLLDHVLFRVGLVACLRSMQKKKAIGLMITASHNIHSDNGVKIIDLMGDMLEQSWEKLVTNIVNSEDTVHEKIMSIIRSNEICVSEEGCLILGWDTRPSSEHLVLIACEGVDSLNGNVKKIGLCTTPVLHYIVRCCNDPIYGIASIDGYYEKLLSSFDKLWTKFNRTNNCYSPHIYFDGANGVGAITMDYVSKNIGDKVKVDLYNDDIKTPEKLNNNCGADFIKSQQKLPLSIPAIPYARLVSFDGDADRIMYYFVDKEEHFHLLDGDRMATLIAMFLQQIVQEIELNTSLGIVQTAYANGSSTKFITETLKVDVSCVRTGVKYLHHEALKYDIGIYFEANGHGTVIFSQHLKDELKQKLVSDNEKIISAATVLSLFIAMVNETVGDALSDLLIVETILHAKDWDLLEWEKLYDALPYQMSKVTVKNRNAITTTDAERRCLTPAALQPKIDEVVSSFKFGRAFVRPSGTEDIVRVYAEAATQTEANELALRISILVYDLAGGIGERPSLFD